MRTPNEGYQAPTAYDGYTLVWSDEFNGNIVNPANWKFDLGNGVDGLGNGELQHYRAENAIVDDGLLAIEAQKHKPKLYGDIGYTSAKLKTEDLFEFRYGRIDARAVAAKGQGLWSAIWMLGANHSDVGWPRSGEINILDTIGGTRDGLPQEAMLVNNMYWNAAGSSTDAPYSLGSINQNGSAEYWLNEPTDESYTRPLHWDVDNLPDWMAGPSLATDNPNTDQIETEIRPLMLTGCEGPCIDEDNPSVHKTPVDVDNLPNWITEDPDWINWENAGGSTETFSNTFHVFSLIWTENKITFEVDGVKTNEIDITGALAEHYRQTFYLILNVAVGGNWPKAPSETTAFSDGMLVDYVRVYQADSDGDGIADYDWDGETILDPDSPFYNGPGSSTGFPYAPPPAPPAPPIFSTSYDGLGALDIRLDMTAAFSSDPYTEIQPTVTNEGTTFNVPAIYFVDPDGDDVEDNPGAFAGFLHNPYSEVKLYSYTDATKGQAYLDAVQEDAMAADALQAAEDAFMLDPYNQSLEADFENAATWAKYSAEELSYSSYYSNTLTFGSGGYIYLKGSVPSDGNVDVYFKIDHFEIDPLTGEFAIDENGQKKLIESFVTNDITIKGSDLGFYGINIDSIAKQGNSIAMVINTPDTDAVITDIRVITTVARDEIIRGPYFFNNVFSGGSVALVYGPDGNLLLGYDNALPPY
jgi:beta-glucanase (GH16 family)